MNFSSALGFTGTVIDLVRATPQLTRLLRERKSFGVSADASGTSFVVSMGWTAYGLMTRQPYVTLASGIMAGAFFIVTLAALRFGRSVREFRIAPVWMAVLSLLGAFFGENGLGAALSISALVSNLPQIRVAYRELNLSGLSLWTWLLSLSGGLVWGFYGILQRDVTIMISAFLQSITSGIIIMLKVTRTLKSVPPVGELPTEL
jgi:uncharacterized protein with PQ loop repeat